MENQNPEERRAFNIIWNAAADYSFVPETMVYDENGQADLYGNYIIGAAHKYYDFSLLTEFFNELKRDPNQSFFKKITWLGLENCTFHRAKSQRPVLAKLRLSYANTVVHAKKESPLVFFDKIKIAHYLRVLGKEPVLARTTHDLLKDLEFDESMTTEQIIFKLRGIIALYFGFSSAYTMNTQENGNAHGRLPDLRSDFLRKLLIAAGRYYEARDLEDMKKSHTITSLWRYATKKREERHEELAEKKALKQRERMQNKFGMPLLTQMQIQAWEKKVCNGNHKNCHLHFTRGEFAHEKLSDYGKTVAQQKNINIKHYRKNIARNNVIISRLASTIRNTILVDLASAPSRAVAGRLMGGKVWRGIYVNDSKIFIKEPPDDMGKISVDIMLDASGSQIRCQEIIAEEGYIIAESLTRCAIPVRVYSFFNRENYLIINLFRDYGEINGNNNIFRYSSFGCNRDGLAIRTALSMMAAAPCEKRILIVLSDVKPNDAQFVYTGDLFPGTYGYSDAPAIDDTAREVRKGLRQGMAIFCIFTGSDVDIPAAKRIYGRNFIRIKSMEKFAAAVGSLVQNELRNF